MCKQTGSSSAQLMSSVSGRNLVGHRLSVAGSLATTPAESEIGALRSIVARADSGARSQRKSLIC